MKKALLLLSAAMVLGSCDYYKIEKRDFKVLHQEDNDELTLEDVKTKHIFDGINLDYSLSTSVGDTVTLLLGQRDTKEGQIVIEPVHPSIYTSHVNSVQTKGVVQGNPNIKTPEDSINYATFENNVECNND